MAYPLGLPTVDLGGGTYQGTTPEGVQRILGQSYMNEGIIPGTTGTGVMPTSGWNYRVIAGAAFSYTSTTKRTGIVIPFEETLLPCDPAPTAGAGRVDTIWVDQSGIVRLNQGSSSAGGAGVILGRFVLPAGAKNTAGGTSNWDRVYAIPTGASLGRLFSFHEPGHVGPGNPALMTLTTGRISLPSDRIINFKMTHSFASVTGEQTTLRWWVYIDDVLVTSFVSRIEGTYGSHNYQEYTQLVPMGSHTVTLKQDRVGGAEYYHMVGGSDMMPGNRFEIWDGGVTR